MSDTLTGLKPSYTVHVTLDDIADGHPCNALYCPVARAAQRAMRDDLTGYSGANSISAGTTKVTVMERLDDPKAGYLDARYITTQYKLPAAAQEYILRFDQGEPGNPFSFTMERMSVDTN